VDEREFEIAAELEELERQSGIFQAQRAVKVTRPETFDGHCVLCEADIPPARVACGYFQCVDCVGEFERRKKQYL
jgi:RNA polymerase-binding transcription factor DksA